MLRWLCRLGRGLRADMAASLARLRSSAETAAEPCLHVVRFVARLQVVITCSLDRTSLPASRPIRCARTVRDSTRLCRLILGDGEEYGSAADGVDNFIAAAPKIAQS
jgi:hypothetical protein